MPSKPKPKPSNPTRPEISYIQVFFKDRPPIIIDPNEMNCLTWGEEGAKVLEGFYLHKGEKGKAAQVMALWKGKTTSKDSSNNGQPTGIGKSKECHPLTWPIKLN